MPKVTELALAFMSTINLNVEYQELKYGKANLEQIGPFSPGTTLSDVELRK